MNATIDFYVPNDPYYTYVSQDTRATFHFVPLFEPSLTFTFANLVEGTYPIHVLLSSSLWNPFGKVWVHGCYQARLGNQYGKS